MYEAGDVRIEDVADPVLKESTDALVRVTTACICGSDLHPYRSLSASDGPVRMGHEFIGVVEEIGSEVRSVRPYRHIDTAAAYGNEREVGQAIRESGVSRDEVFIETKIWISDYGYDETLHSFEKSAGKLGVEHIDLLILRQALPYT
jgi:NADPH:quinone reductase-like Zn-dependent oxidoreductase